MLLSEAFKLKENIESTNNVPLEAANGTEVKNHGENNLFGYSADWVPLAANVQIAEVRSNLGAGMKMIEADNRIILDKGGSYIENKRTGSRIKINREGGAFTFEFWVPGFHSQKGPYGSHPIKRPTKKAKINTGMYDAFNPDDEEESNGMDIGAINMVLSGRRSCERSR